MYNFLVSKHLSFPKEDLFEKLPNNRMQNMSEIFGAKLKGNVISVARESLYLSCHRKWSEFGIQGLLGPKKVVPEKNNCSSFSFLKKFIHLKWSSV
jgi:hypothetical protein